MRYVHRDWVRPDMSNMECAPIVDDRAVLPPFDESYELDYSAILGPIVSVFFDSGLPDRHRIFARTEDERYRDLAIRKRDYEVFFHRLKANLCEFRTLEDMANLLIRTRPGTTREDVEEFFRQRRDAMKTCDESVRLFVRGGLVYK